MIDDATSEETGRARFAATLNRLERTYLSAIRAIALLIATLLIVYAAWLTISGIYKTSRDTSSVKEVAATVTPQELTQIDVAKLKATEPGAKPDPLADEKRFFADFSKRYFALYRTKFERFRKPDDQQLNLAAFQARYLAMANPSGRDDLALIATAPSHADLESLLATMAAAADEKVTTDRLRSYQRANKIKVRRKVSGSREETYCDYYGVYSGGCLLYGTRTVPYTRIVEELRLPDNIVSHADLFAAYQDRFMTTLDAKKRKNATMAQDQRDSILSDNVDGSARLWTAVQVFGGFLALMFLFLLIALERHQRKLAAATNLD